MSCQGSFSISPENIRDQRFLCFLRKYGKRPVASNGLIPCNPGQNSPGNIVSSYIFSVMKVSTNISFHDIVFLIINFLVVMFFG